MKPRQATEHESNCLIGWGLVLLLAAGIGAWLLCSGCVTPNPTGPLDNLSCVDTNRGVWRSAQPTQAGFARLASLGVTNSVKLDTASEGTDYAANVLARPLSWEQQAGLAPISQQWIEDVLQWIHAHPGTVVHCLHGEDRTGLIVACYRVRFMGWSKAAAEEEMLKRGFHPALRGLWEAWEGYEKKGQIPLGPKMSALHAKALSAARPVPRLAVVPPSQPRITVLWNCAPDANAAYYVTGLEGSTNLRSWYQVARLPYQVTNVITLSNRPPMEFYRAYNAFAFQ